MHRNIWSYFSGYKFLPAIYIAVGQGTSALLLLQNFLQQTASSSYCIPMLAERNRKNVWMWNLINKCCLGQLMFVFNLASPTLHIYVSGVGSVPPGKSVLLIYLWTERRVQLDCNVPPGQRHPDSVRSVGVLWWTRQAERQTWSQLCGQQDEEGELQYCNIAIDY